MKRKQNVLFKMLSAFTLATIMTTSTTTIYASDAGRIIKTFSNIEKNSVNADALIYDFSNETEVPIYSDEKGYGFVEQTRLEPIRNVNTKKIKKSKEGFSVLENNPLKFKMVDKDGKKLAINKCTTRNFGGMIFRTKAQAGGYKITVEVGDSSNSLVTVSGMENARIEATGAWDAAKLVPMAHPAQWNGNIWTFEYANGLDTIDIEIEPAKVNTPVEVKKIILEPIPVKTANEDEKPTIFTLGDSTVKSYTFDETPMSSWGQVFDKLFDEDKVNVINYSMGGRSVRQMYTEGRLNDILMTGKKGDIVLIQSGHNDERNGTAKGTADGETARFGRGATEEMYANYLKEVYLPAVKAREMVAVLVSPCSRVSKDEDDSNFINSFTKRKFVDVMKKVAEETDTAFIDLNTRSVEYFNELGDSIYNIVMSLEAGETPGKTNSGSYANGHPDNKIDATHYKEALAKQYCKMIIEEFSKQNTDVSKTILASLKSEVTEALENDNWEKVYPEVCKDTISGDGSYYRNQIEKLVQLGIMEKDSQGNFNPKENISISEFIDSLSKMWGIDKTNFAYEDGVLTREVMSNIVYDAYVLHFGYDENNELAKPAFMTDYNGTTVTPDDPNYDANLVGEESQYYPLAGFKALKDTNKINSKYISKFKEAYNLGLIRAEEGIKRGAMINGLYLTPQAEVTREKAAKELYFLWVLDKNVSDENG